MGRKIQIIVLAAASYMVLASCAGSSGGTSSASSYPLGAKGYLVLQFEVQTTPAIYQQIKTANGAQITADGETFDDKNTAIMAPAVPLVGHWVRVGKTLAMADSKGNFTLPPGTTGQKIDLLKDPDDAAPQASFPLSSLNTDGKTANPLKLQVRFQGPAIMGPDGKARPASCCPPGEQRLSLVQERCLDWDGPLGDHVPHPQKSVPGLLGYIKSTCWKNVNSGLCYNEGNTIRNTLGGNPGPPCYGNHKYRMCQSVDETEFTLSDADLGIVTPGTTDVLKLDNNTAGNETFLTLTGPGTLVDTKFGKSGSSITVKHYDDASTQHLITRLIDYQVDSTVTSGTAYIVAQSHGHTLTLTLKISSFAGTYSGEYAGADSQGDSVSGNFAIVIGTDGLIHGTATLGPTTLNIAGKIDMTTGSVSFGTADVSVIQAHYTGQFVNIKGVVSGSGNWTSVNTSDGVTGSGGWHTT